MDLIREKIISQQELADAERLASEAIRDVRLHASDGEANRFATDLSKFINEAKDRALRVKTIQADIVEKQSQIAQAHEEHEALCAARPVLAEKLHSALLAHEQARAAYEEREFTIGITERRIESRRAELTSLRRQLKELQSEQEEN